MERIDNLVAMIKERRLGFRMHEIMSGEHEFEENLGPPGKHPMEFRVNWSVKHLSKFLDPMGDEFGRTDLEGTVTVGGLCTDAPCSGSLDLKYFSERSIRYTFEFEAGGDVYRYVGEKVNIRPWNLAVSHTTCFGTLTEVQTGRLFSRSVTHFRLWRAPAFLASFRPL